MSNLATSDQSQAQIVAPTPPPLPAWIQPSAFEGVFREVCPDFQQVKDFKAIPALGAGENYATVMLRLTADVELKDGSTKNLSFMMKTAHDSEIFQQMMQIHNVFVTETDVYRQVIPEFEEMYREAGLEVKFGANSYELDVESPYILLEDLSTRGFKNENRLEGLDMEHTKAVLNKLAQWHAASAVRVATKGPYNPDLYMGFLKESAREMMRSMMEGLWSIFIECAKSYEGIDECYGAMCSAKDKFMEVFLKLADEENRDFCVLNHGDCWSNNVMFQHDAFGKIKEIYLVDFQTPRYGSPAQDLYYFLISSTKYELKTKQFDYFIKYYHDRLEEYLKLLNYPKAIPSLKELHIIMYKYGLWGFATVSGVMAAVLLDPNENAMVDNFFSDSDVGIKFKMQMFSGTRYRKHCEMLLPWLYNRGAFSTHIVQEAWKELLKPRMSTEAKRPVRSPLVPSSKYSRGTTSSHDERLCYVYKKSLTMTGHANGNAAADTIPKWIKSDLFEDVLKKTVKDFHTVKNFEVKPAAGAGENYATVMLRIEIETELKDGSVKPISYMMKTCHDSDMVREMLKAHNMFDVEKSMYETIVPAFEKLYADAGVEITFGPNCYELPTEESYILLENLTPRGFKNANRLEGLDMDHMHMVLRKLAMWHAASAVYAEQNGDYEDKYRHGFFREESKPMMKSMHDGMHALFMSCLKKYSNHELYYHEMETLHADFLDELYKTVEIDPNEFNVLNHGDCWANNIMFQYDDSGKIQETYLIDYQLPKYGSPAQDLYYFILSSANYDLKLSKFDYFIRYYHDNLQKNLKLLKYSKKVPTLRDIHITLFRRGIWGLFSSTGVMAAVLLDPTKDANLEHFLGDSDKAVAFKMAMYSNDRYRKHMEAIMPWLKYRGAFDLS
ncbi:uncharacterized protein [Musca autumnalis]|uniref:uncharacterized protein n=1 Tax=Musca autumnalis TaxID=221902 RepID=UPI003CF337A9